MPLPNGFAGSHIPVTAFGVRVAVGPAATPPAALKILLVGMMLAAGTATANQVVEVFDSTDGNARFGARSRLAAMVRATRKIAPQARIYACPVADPAGTAATCVLTFSGPATGAGVVRLKIAGQPIREVQIPSGMSRTDAAAAVLAALAEYSELPCTATVGGTGSEHVLTLTSSHASALSNQLRVQFESTAAGLTIALNDLSTATRGRVYFGSASPATAGAGNPSLTTALAAIAGARYDRQVFDIDDDTNRTAVANHLASESGINVGHRCMGAIGSLVDTLTGSGSVAEDATGLNAERLTIVYNRKSHNHGGELAAAYMAAKVYGDANLPGEAQYRAAKANGLSLWPAILATDEDERLTATQANTLLASGVTPLREDNLHPGYAAVTRPVTTRTKNAQGGTSWAAHDTSKVAVADLVADRAELWAATNYADKNLVPDPATIEAAPSSPYVIWPAAIREDMLAILRQMEQDGLLINVEDHAAQVTVTTETVDGTDYAIASIPIAVIRHLHSTVGEVREISA